MNVDDKAANTGAWHTSLSLRLLTIVCLALLPVSALSIWQGVERVRLDQKTARQTLRESALSIANDERNGFVAAERLLVTLAKEGDIRFGRSPCQRRLQDSVRGLTSFDNLGRVAANGTILCAAVLPPSTIDVTNSPWWTQALLRREFFISGPHHSNALRKDVFAGVLPLRAADGSFDGTLNVAIDLEWLTLVNERAPGLPHNSIIALLDKSGTIVASNAPKIAAAVFARAATFAKAPGAIIAATGPDDAPWSLTVAPAFRQEYFVGYAVADSELTRLSYMSVAVDLLLPVLMILLASLAIWWATDRLVVRWIDTLGRMAGAYGKGHYAIRPQALNEAPREFRALGATLSDMASAVQERDRSLKDALAQKDVLVKEVHHRVKNTLQMVMSLLNLQANRLFDPDARVALDQARARINALAIAYRAIYDRGLDGPVDLKPLLSEAIEQVRRSVDETRANVTVSVDVASCKVSGDTAIPLMLFVTEAVMNAFNQGHAELDSGGHISISLQAVADGRMDLVIAGDGDRLETSHPRSDTAIGARLMEAFAEQLSGDMTIRNKKDGGTIVELNFATSQEAAKVPA
jgi:two-component sensor histidine kinase